MRTIFCLLLPVLLTTACSGSKEPTEAILKDMVNKIYNEQKLDSRSVFTVHDVKKLGCKPTSAPGTYSCDVEVDVSMFTSRNKSVQTLEVVRTEEGWLGTKLSEGGK